MQALGHILLFLLAASVTSNPLPDDDSDYAVIPYNYAYEVQDPDTSNFQNKAEVRDEEGNVFGSYSVLMPDGYIYTTTYNVTGESGFVSRLVKTRADIPEPRALTPDISEIVSVSE